MRSRLTGVALLFALTWLPAIANAQWLDYKTPGIPRLPDGKPNLSAPAPRTPDGKPDLNGLWQAMNSANYDIQVHTAKAALQMRPGPVVPVPSREGTSLGAP